MICGVYFLFLLSEGVTCYPPANEVAGRFLHLFMILFTGGGWGSLSKGGLCQRGGEEGLCPEGPCPEGGLCPQESLSGRASNMVKSGWYVSYWNAFL